MHIRIDFTGSPDAGSGRALRGLLLSGLAGAILSGCGAIGGNHVIVGSIPDDYRTRHPIIISEKEHTFDIPVATGDRHLTMAMRESVRGAADRYLSMSTGAVRIMVPHGSLNAGAAAVLSGEIADELKSEGIPANRIIMTSYPSFTPQDAAPIRIAFTATTAFTGECGRWPEDMMANPDENRNYENFGCASQSNLAAQIANPTDLLGPRGASPIDAERRETVIGDYRSDGAGLGEF